MGAAASNLNVSDQEVMNEIENKKGVVDKALTDNLTNITDLLSQFSKNDTQSIVNKIQSMDEFKGKIPPSVLTRASQVHKSILDTLDASLSPEQKNKALESNSAVASYIKKYVDKDLDEKMSNYLQNPFIKNDPIVNKSMVDVTNSIKSIRSKYKYFEYKYVQMNIFLILFTKHIHTTVSKFIDESTALYEAREKYHLVLIHNVVKTFQEQLGDEAKQLTDINTSDFTNAIKELASSVMGSIEKQKQVGEKMKEDSLNGILKFLMEKEEDFASEIIKSVETYKTEHNDTKGVKTDFISAPTFQGNKDGYTFASGVKGQGYYLNVASKSPEYGPINKPSFMPATSFEGARPGYAFKSGPNGSGYYENTGMRGGFIRDNSLLPQDFFKL